MENTLTAFDLELLRETEQSYPDPYVYIVWRALDGRIEFGPVRYRYAPREDLDGMWMYSASPFPGAWSTVREDRILAVRHAKAMR